MTFSEYLISKKIDEAKFKNAEIDMYAAWQKEFEFTHPESFTSQKRFLINKIRRLYHLL
jgi:hypothetical protein